MTKLEMLLKSLKKSGWTVTTEKDEDGYAICVPSSDNKNEETTRDN